MCAYIIYKTALFLSGQNGETTQYSPAIQHTLEVYLNGVDSQHSSDSEFYWQRVSARSNRQMFRARMNAGSRRGYFDATRLILMSYWLFSVLV